jgi:hypothetical protein
LAIPDNGRGDANYEDINRIAPPAPVPALPPAPDTPLVGNPVLIAEHQPVQVMPKDAEPEPTEKPATKITDRREYEQARALGAMERLDTASY